MYKGISNGSCRMNRLSLVDDLMLRIFSEQHVQHELDQFTASYNQAVQFISASRLSAKYFIRNTGTGSGGRSCHLSHCPHKFTHNNKIQMKLHSKKTTKNIHSKDSYSAVNSPHISTFENTSCAKNSIPNCVWKHCFHTGSPCKALKTWDDTAPRPGQPISVTQSQQPNKQINNWKMRHMSNKLTGRYHSDINKNKNVNIKPIRQ